MEITKSERKEHWAKKWWAQAALMVGIGVSILTAGNFLLSWGADHGDLKGTLNEMRSSIDQLRTDLIARIGEQETRQNARMDNQDKRMDKQDARMDKMDEKLDTVIADLGVIISRLDGLENDMESLVNRMDLIVANIRVQMTENLILIFIKLKQSLNADTQRNLIEVLDQLIAGLSRAKQP